MPDTFPKTLLGAVRHFSDADACHQYMLRLKWPDGHPVCPKCGGDNIGHVASRRILQCRAKGCRKQFSAKVGTVMEDSPLPETKWLVAMWAARHGVTSVALAEAIDVTQKTAWLMLDRIRRGAEAAEEWRPVVGFEGYYEVSSLGNVRSVARTISQAGKPRRLQGRPLSQKRTSNGYREVTLKAAGAGVPAVCRHVHRLVLEAFIGPCPEGMQVRHFPDRDKGNNRLTNLSWGTPKANQADRIAHGTTVNGERSHLSKLSAEQVRDVRRRLAAGEKLRAIASDLGVDEATIGHIKHRRSWASLT